MTTLSISLGKGSYQVNSYVAVFMAPGANGTLRSDTWMGDLSDLENPKLLDDKVSKVLRSP